MKDIYYEVEILKLDNERKIIIRKYYYLLVCDLQCFNHFLRVISMKDTTT